jgi:hypothetical protein
MIMLRPIPPQPITAVELPALARAVLMTAPTPVATAQPMTAATSKGTSAGMGIAPASSMTAYWDIVEAVR